MVHYTGIRAPITRLRKDEKFPDWYYIDIDDDMGGTSTIHVHKEFVEYKGLRDRLVGMKCEFNIAVLDSIEEKYPYERIKDIINIDRHVEGIANKDGKLRETEIIDNE